MTKILLNSVLILFFLGYSVIVEGQIKDSTKYSYWVDDMFKSTPNMDDARTAFDAFWKERTSTSSNGYKPFKRWEMIMQNNVDNDNNVYSSSHILNEYQSKAAGDIYVNYGNWEELGPYNNSNITNGVGRINCLALSDDNLKLYAGSPTGGLWVRVIAGGTWEPLTDNIPAQGVSSILINGSTIYIGTGDRDARYSPGFGVYKSTDGGTTWVHKNNGMGNVTVNKLIQDPNNPLILVAATSNGIFKTTDGGDLWYLKSDVDYVNGINFIDIESNPVNFNIIYAVKKDMIYRSIDAGESFTDLNISSFDGSYRIEIEINPSDPDVIYALLSTQMPFKGFYKSSNGGLDWEEYLSQDINILGRELGLGTDYWVGQGWYDLVLGCSPTTNDLFVGGINIWKSNEITGYWDRITYWHSASPPCPIVHADQHCMIFDNSGVIYVGHDGGVSISNNNGVTWTDISAGLRIGNVYKIGQSSTDQDSILAGLQDNGTIDYQGGTNWNHICGGDGLECLYHPSEGKYFSVQDKIIMNGTSTNQIYNDDFILPLFNLPYAINKSNTDEIFIGGRTLIKGEADPLSIQDETTNKISEEQFQDIASSNYQNLVYGIGYDNITTFDNSTKLFWAFADAYDMSVVWHQYDLIADFPDIHHLTDIVVVPSNGSSSTEFTVYITANNKVIKVVHNATSVISVTDMDIANSLPNVGFNCILYDETSTNECLYIGTSIGVFHYNSTINTWVSYNNQFPAAIQIMELEMFYPASGSNIISAASFGRSIWRSTVEDVVFTITGSSIPASNVNCDGSCVVADGSAIVTPTPSGTYTYLWSNGQTTQTATGLCPGTYSVTISDNTGNTAVAVVEVGPDMLNASTEITYLAKTCEDASIPGDCVGELSITVSGAFHPFQLIFDGTTYSSSTGEFLLTGVCSGFYDYTITDSNLSETGGCTFNGAFEMPKAPPIQIVSKGVIPECFGDCHGQYAIGEVFGGTPIGGSGYEYSFDYEEDDIAYPLVGTIDPGNGGITFNNLCDGNYSITVTDAEGCTENFVHIINIEEETEVFTDIISIETEKEIEYLILSGQCGEVRLESLSCADSFTWYEQTGVSPDPSSDIVIGTSTSSVFMHVFSPDIIHTIYVIYYIDGIPDTSETLQILIETPNCEITGGELICNFTDYNIYQTVDNNPEYHYEWTTVGGTPSYTESPFNVVTWLPGQSSYSLSLTVTNEYNCSCSNTQLLSVFLPKYYIIKNPKCVCDGEVKIYIPSGTSGYSYEWSHDGSIDFSPTDNSIIKNGLCAGDYSVTVTDLTTGCQNILNFNLPDGDPSDILDLVVESTTSSICGECNGEAEVTSIVETHPSPPYSFLWNDPLAQTNLFATNLCPGNYCVTVTDSNDCSYISNVLIEEMPLDISFSTTNITCAGDCNGSATAFIDISPQECTYNYLWSNGATTQTINDLCAGMYMITATSNCYGENGDFCIATDHIAISAPQFTAFASATGVSCFGASNGTATVTVFGGTAPFSYLWSDGQTGVTATGLTVGDYTVQVTDNNGCIVNASVSIIEPPVLTCNIVEINHVSCFGENDGQASVFITGGTAPYTVLWDNGQTDTHITNLVTGTYVVHVTDNNGCQCESSVTITEPNEIVYTSINLFDQICQGNCDGSISATGEGGDGNLTFHWNFTIPGVGGGSSTNNPLTGLCSGASITGWITDEHGCTSASINEEIPVTLPPIVNTTPTNISCNGLNNGSINLFALGIPTLSYVWSNGETTEDISNLSAGTYTVTVTDGQGCTSVSTATIIEPEIISINIIDLINVNCHGDCTGGYSVGATGGTGTLLYDYSNGPVGYSYPQSFAGLCAGNYTISVTDDNHCVVTTTITINEPTPLTVNSLTKSEVICSGECNGVVTNSASGGTIPYTYRWQTTCSGMTSFPFSHPNPLDNLCEG
ncbi:MAG: hypothetical protein CVU05_09455, partial [Bacteroidetes bacterium HGW-Bacteroidetes-21]